MIRNFAMFMAGLVFLLLAKLKNMVRGYATPKSFGIRLQDQCFDYDTQVVDKWLAVLRDQAPGGVASIRGRKLLELGPGSDLGIGMILRARGAAQYTAFDVNALDAKVSDGFYVYFAERLQQQVAAVDAPALLEEVRMARAGRGSTLRYVVRSDFNLVGALPAGDMEIVFSNAAFEHFDDVATTAQQLFEVCAPGAVVVICIDLQTHSRWIREVDPNNIYRYPAWLYRLFHFRGIPNRLRPSDYAALFSAAGWQDLRILRDDVLAADDVRADVSGMNQRFRGNPDEMRALSVTLIARR